MAAASSSKKAADAALLRTVPRRFTDQILAQRSAGDLPWLAARAVSSSSAAQGQKQDPSIAALDALLASYGV
jgi:hypothetical protein